MPLNRFSGTPGAAVTSANSGGASGDAFSVMNPTTPTGTFVYSDDLVNPITGGTVGKVAAGASVAAEARWTTVDSTSAAVQLVYRATGAPTTASCDDVAIRGTRQNAGRRLHTAGDSRLLNLGTEIGGGATWAGIINEWLVLDLVVVEGSTASNGTIKGRLRRLSDLATVVASYTSTARDAGVIGTDVINSLRVGKTTSGAVLPALYLAQVQGIAGATDWLPDPGGNVAPLASITSDATGAVEPGATITLTLGDSDADGTVTTRTLTQTAGATAAPAGSGSTRTVVAPYTLAGTTLTYQYVVTDDDGATSTPVSTSIEVLPATERIVITGGASPVEAPARIEVV